MRYAEPIRRNLLGTFLRRRAPAKHDREPRHGSIAVQNPIVNWENGTIDGQECDYRVWARCACR